MKEFVDDAPFDDDRDVLEGKMNGSKVGRVHWYNFYIEYNFGFIREYQFQSN